VVDRKGSVLWANQDGINERERIRIHCTDDDMLVWEAENRLQGIQVELTPRQTVALALKAMEIAHGLLFVEGEDDRNSE
jgi:hypothetical protein